MSSKTLAERFRPYFRTAATLPAYHRRPDTIQLDFGQPFPASIPTTGLAEGARKGLEREGWQALRYGGGPSCSELRDFLASWSEPKGVRATGGDVLITTGSMQAIDLVAGVMLEPGDAVLVEAPTYFSALRRFAFCGATIYGFPMDEHGLQVETVAGWLEDRSRQGKPAPKFVYTVANFQNPTGRTLSLARRQRLLDLAYLHGFAILEDDAYGDLYFTEPPPPAFRALDHEGNHTIYVSTLSKTVAPGLRLGWVIASKEVLAALQRAKNDGGTSPLAQALTLAFLKDLDFPGRVAALRQEYAGRWSTMRQSLLDNLPPGAFFTETAGGFFTWLTLPGNTDMAALEVAAQDEGVTYVPGSAFFFPERAVPAMRLCFSFCAHDQLEDGVKRLVRAIAASQ
ncbi:MAG: PLP-dependent aminotransferase family protein [Bacillota bacterium]